MLYARARKADAKVRTFLRTYQPTITPLERRFTGALRYGRCCPNTYHTPTHTPNLCRGLSKCEKSVSCRDKLLCMSAILPIKVHSESMFRTYMKVCPYNRFI